MKREEQMMAAAEEYSGINEEYSQDSLLLTNAFAAGWQAADKNPNWISVEERLPEHNEEENGLITFPEVLVCLCDGYRTTDCYDDTREKWLGWNGQVEYWMPTPPAPRKED